MTLHRIEVSFQSSLLGDDLDAQDSGFACQ